MRPAAKGLILWSKNCRLPHMFPINVECSVGLEEAFIMKWPSLHQTPWSCLRSIFGLRTRVQCPDFSLTPHFPDFLLIMLQCSFHLPVSQFAFSTQSQNSPSNYSKVVVVSFDSIKLVFYSVSTIITSFVLFVLYSAWIMCYDGVLCCKLTVFLIISVKTLNVLNLKCCF